MSTGLTWVSIVDPDAAAPDSTSSVIAFSDYEEAKKYGLWYCRWYGTFLPITPVKILIYTTSPAQNGWCEYVGAGASSFFPFD
jgi:hypothetical protein